MEYAAGGSLQTRLDQARQERRPLPIDECVRIALDIAQGLAAIHPLDIVHRDLKPSNILFDEQGRAKVADLGLAQVPGGPSLRSVISQGVPHPGTPGYMSPEQEKTYGHLTPASDVYALGLLLFEMLTGRMYRNVRPGTRVRTLREEVPEWLDDLVARMLAQNPEERPWDGAEVIELLTNPTKLQPTQSVAKKTPNPEDKPKGRAQYSTKSNSDEPKDLYYANCPNCGKIVKLVNPRLDKPYIVTTDTSHVPARDYYESIKTVCSACGKQFTVVFWYKSSA
jgi:serine/threonine protein kinase